MTIYVVGDVQGCFDPLQRLLQQVAFDPPRDQLWSVGDLVNRGPASLQTLRYLKSLGASFRMVLGNHDLHLLAVARRGCGAMPGDTLEEILDAPDCADLLDWLQVQPLLIHAAGYTLVHAGIPPQWTLQEAQQRAAEVETVLRSPQAEQFFAAMYGNQPDTWCAQLSAPERWRTITNYFTRMRFCHQDGRLELRSKQPPEHPPLGFAPWFAHANRRTLNEKIIFGHWAALAGRNVGANVFPLDTGCVWGDRLRLMCLDSEQYVEWPCSGQHTRST